MDGPVALVTGASSGIGEAFARALGARGHELVITARRADRLQQLANELRGRYGVTALPVVADLSTPAGVDDLTSAVERLDVAVDLLVNNAGYGSYGRFHELPLSRELAMIDLNVRALVALTGHFLPPMVARRRGTIIQIASTTSFQPVPYMAVYGATKSFVLNFSEAVAHECAAMGVRVLAVCPGHTPTGFQKESGVDQRPTRTSAQPVEDVVAESLAALDGSDTHVVVTGLPNKLTTQLPRVLPRRVLSAIVERAFRPR